MTSARPNQERAQLVDRRLGEPLPERRARTLAELVAGALERHRDRAVLVEGGRRWSWQDLDRASGALAARWAGSLGPGERVAILLPNGAAHLVAELAAWRLGAVAAPVSTALGSACVRAALARLSPRLALLADDSLCAALPADCRAVPATESLTPCGAHPVASWRAAEPSDPVLIQLTSGSSGVPRGVVLGNDNIASQQAAYAMLWPAVGPGDRIAAYLPWHHSFGGQAERLWALLRGVEVHVVPGGGRDRDRFLATVRAVAPTLFLSVPKLHAVAAEQELFAPQSLRWAFTAGAPLPACVRAWYEARGIPVHEGWGLTETSPSACITRLGVAREPGVVGPPIPGVAVGVERAGGRILVSGPNVMLGYHGAAAPNLERSADGRAVLDSGDLGAWTPSGLRLIGRGDSMLKLGNGEKAWAPEIEERLVAEGALHAVVGVAEQLVAVVEAASMLDDRALAAVVERHNAQECRPWCRIARLVRLLEPMSVDNGMLTGSMKVSRGAVLERWQRWEADGTADFRAIAFQGARSTR